MFLLLTQAALADSRTNLATSGDSGSHTDIVFIGEGFTAADQATFNSYVDTTVAALFLSDALGNSVSAYNISRINLDSVDSGTGTISYLSDDPGGDSCSGNLVPDASGNAQVVTSTVQNTPFGIQTNCRNTSCWFTNPPDFAARLDAVVKLWAPEADVTIIVSNTSAFGGCSGGSLILTTLTGDATTLRHELGHNVGGLGDEYQSGAAGPYTGAEPGWPNVTATLSSVKWSRFIDPATPIPTTQADIAPGHESTTVGAFEGATPGYAGSGASTGVWRPTFDGVMNGASQHNPVGYQAMMDAQRYQIADPNQTLVGDFNGDGVGDLVVHRGTQLDLYLGNQDGELTPAWFEGLNFPGWDFFLYNDRFYVADFDGDGKDDLYVTNVDDYFDTDGSPLGYLAMLRSTGTAFEVVARYDKLLPGWDNMYSGDQFFVGDFDGDGRGDIGMFNGQDYPIAYLGLLRSEGTSLSALARYDGSLAGWQLAPHDEVIVGDYDGDGSDDVALFNTSDWKFGYLGLAEWDGAGLAITARYDQEISGWDDFLAHDVLLAGDYDGDGMDDLFIWNADQWDKPYLGVLRSLGGELEVGSVWGGSVPGWTFNVDDQHVVGDLDNDGRADLAVWNTRDWDYPYLGVILSRDGSPQGAWQEDSIGDGTSSDPACALHDIVGLAVVDIAGTAGFDDLVAWKYNSESVSIGFLSFDVTEESTFAVLQSYGGLFVPTAVYPNWVANYEYEASGYW